jgi:hypothetical protein
MIRRQNDAYQVYDKNYEMNTAEGLKGAFFQKRACRAIGEQKRSKNVPLSGKKDNAFTAFFLQAVSGPDRGLQLHLEEKTQRLVGVFYMLDEPVDKELIGLLDQPCICPGSEIPVLQSLEAPDEHAMLGLVGRGARIPMLFHEPFLGPEMIGYVIIEKPEDLFDVFAPLPATPRIEKQVELLEQFPVLVVDGTHLG